MPTTSYTHRETYRGAEVEIDCTVDYDIEPGEKAIRYGDNACPGSDPEVTINTVTVDATGEDITDECDLDALADDIVEEVGRDEAAAREDAEERRAEERRDARMWRDG